MPHSRVRVDDGVELHVALDGSPERPALALINGALTNLDVFTPAMDALLARFFVIRHDWRGSGRSSGGPRPSYRFERYADDLAAVLDHAGVERAVICGMAYGARTAARFALRHPSRVSLLALYDVSLDQPVDQSLQQAGNAEAKRLRAEAGIPEPVRDRAWFQHADQKEALRSLTAHVDQPDPTDALATVAVPTLVVCGRQDVNLPQAERIAALMPDAELLVMEMTGHGSVLSRPDLFAELLVDFADRRLPSS
jgi:3-oxoadipate enol-lactonase